VMPPAWVNYVDAALVAAWALVSLTMLARLAWAMRALSRVERSAASEVIDGVRVLVTPAIGPAVFGARRPRLLVPQWLLDLDAPLRALVLRHEQEHCRSRDPQLTLAIAVALALVPWNLGVWWIARRLRLAVELDCDARVLRTDEDSQRYSRLLLFIAQRQSQTRLAPMLAESNSHLSRRITAMHAPRPANPRLVVVCLALAAAGALACSTRYAADLTTAPSMPSSLRAGASQAGTVPGQQGAVSVRSVPGSPAPRYPDILKQSGVEGEVTVAFVVDSTGFADARSLKIVASSHELFANAVRTVLPEMKFLPADMNGRKVRQLVRQTFLFIVQGSADAAERNRAAQARVASDQTNASYGATLNLIVITAVNR
jgi:TonB family protein